MMYGNLHKFFKGEFQTVYKLQSVVGFHQHKMAMKYRLDYLESKQVIGPEVAESFLAVCKHAEVIKNLYVKSTITQNESSLAAIIAKLAEVKVMEEKILLQALSQLPKP